MRVKDIMTTPVVTAGPETPVKEIASLLIRNAISAVPVVDEAGDLLGIVSEADLVPLETAPDPRRRVMFLPPRERRVPRVAREVMTADVVVLNEDADVAEAARLMTERGIKRIPVVSGRRVVGIVSRRDLIEVLARSDEDIRAELDALLADEIETIGRFEAEVSGGVVTLRGSPDRTDRRLAALLARSVSGVVAVAFADD